MPPPVGHAGELVRHGLVLHLLAVLVELDVGVDSGLDDQGMAGLVDVIHRPQGQAPLLALDIGQAGNQNHGDMAGSNLLLQFFQQGEAVHFRHHHVQHNEGVVPSSGLGQTVLWRLHGRYVVVLREDIFQMCRLYQAVINNQNLFHSINSLLCFIISFRN